MFADEETRLIVRPYNEYDPMVAGFGGIPLPISAVQGIITGDINMTLEALVDVNGDVASRMLTTASTIHLRCLGQWILLTNLEAIADLDVVAIEDAGIGLYDSFDQVGQSVRITSMPVKPDDYFRVAVGYAASRSRNPHPSL